MVRDALSSFDGSKFIALAASLTLVLSAACDGCKEKPSAPDVGTTTTQVVEEDTGPDEPVDPLAEAREEAEGHAESGAIHLSDIARSVGAEIEAQANKPKPKRRANIKRKKPQDTGKLAKAQLNKVFNVHADAMKKCYERSLKKMPGLQGKVRVNLRIKPDGVVETVNVRGLSLNDPTVLGCMEREAQTMKFPEPDGGSVRVVKVYSFFPEL